MGAGQGDATGGGAGGDQQQTPPTGAGVAGAGTDAGATQQTPPAATQTQQTDGARGGQKVPPTPVDLEGDDEPIPKNGRVSLSVEDLNRRIARAQRQTLKDIGAETSDDAKAKIEKAKAADAKEEEARRASLAAEERLKEDLAKEKKEKETAQSQLRKFEREHARAAATKQVHAEAGEVIASKYVESAAVLFKNHVRELIQDYGQAYTDKLPDDYATTWFTKHAEKFPEQAKTAAANVTETTPIVTGSTRNDRPPPNGSGAAGVGKTYAPNQPNSMSNEEIAAARKAEGYRW